MSQDFTFIVEISADGREVQGTVQGMAGKSCGNVAALLDKVGRELEHRHTEDYDRPEPVRWRATTGGKLQVGW